MKTNKKAGDRIRTDDVQLGNYSVSSINTLETYTYGTGNSILTTDLTSINDKIQQNLATLINRWSNLPSHIQTAIMTLVEGNENEKT